MPRWKPLRGIEATLQDHGGYVADDLIVRERGGQFSCAIGTRYGEPGRILLSYDPALRTPLSRIDWASDGSLRPTGGLTGLTTPQRALLEAWLELVLHTGKLEQVRAAYPIFPSPRGRCVSISRQRVSPLLAESTDVDVRTQLFRSHSALARGHGIPRLFPHSAQAPRQSRPHGRGSVTAAGPHRPGHE